MLRTARDPDVGFCLSISAGISCRETVQMARIGMPAAENSVYFTLTEVTYDGKLVIAPHLKTTSGGIGLSLACVFSVAMQQEKSFSTASTTLPSCLAVASKNISSVSLPGSGPLNSGGAAAFDPVDGLLSHFTVLAMVNSLGLNWKSILPISTSSFRPPVVGDGGVRVPPLPPCIGEVITHRRAGCHGARPQGSRSPPSGCRGSGWGRSS